MLATDLCGPARPALAFARQIARRRSVPVRAVHVLDLSGEAGPPSFTAAHSSAERALRAIRRELRTAGIENAATLVSAGKPAAALAELVQQHQPSLLILGLCGTSRAPAAIGTTARPLLADPPCPILTVNDRCPESPAPDSLAAVVIVVDSFQESLRTALAIWPLDPRQPPPTVLAVQPDAPRTRRAPAASPHREIPLNPAQAAKEVLRHAARSGLVIAAFRSGSPLASLTPGSLAHTLLTQAPCPVLTLRA
ncbi:MAG TPA: universal stress protein [Acidobacteriaceae bacterium]|nr:universal stress protein [Acidobacteriaceae bacterium]